jgi:branched-chain amino acid aminotransferase
MQININKAAKSRIAEVDFSNLPFGREFTDHMMICDYDGKQWLTPEIVPYGPISVSPALSAVHYGQSLFEGMKAHKSADGRAWLFRPRDNWNRLNASAERMCMPTIPEEIFMEGLKALIGLDEAWIPTQSGSSLYIRPFMFASDDCIGVRPSDRYRYMVICCPVNAFYSKALRVKAEDKYVRAIEGGVGYAKAAGNYGSSMLPTRLAQEQGFDQLIWLDGKEHKYVEESGTMNLFFVVDGGIITPKLSGTILDGYTRDSILQLAKDNGISVEERRISIDEVKQWTKEGRLTEIFGTGTAATLVQISSFNHLGEEYTPLAVDQRTISVSLASQLNAIKIKEQADIHGWMMEVELASKMAHVH